MVLLQNVSKLYRLYRRPADRLRELLPRARARHTDFWALRDIGFSLEKGETPLRAALREVEELVRFVRDAGRVPVQRDSLYNELRRWDD